MTSRMIRQEVARRQSSPFTGKLSARPAGKPGIFPRQREFATIPSPPLASRSYQNTEGPQYAFSKACRNLSGPMGFQNQNQNQNQNQPLSPDRAASRRSARAQGKERVGRDHAPSHRPQMSSGRLFLDRVARQHCPSPLHRHAQTTTPPRPARPKPDISTLQRIGHFYFALTSMPGSIAAGPEQVIELRSAFAALM